MKLNYFGKKTYYLKLIHELFIPTLPFFVSGASDLMGGDSVFDDSVKITYYTSLF